MYSQASSRDENIIQLFQKLLCQDLHGIQEEIRNVISGEQIFLLRMKIIFIPSYLVVFPSSFMYIHIFFNIPQKNICSLKAHMNLRNCSSVLFSSLFWIFFLFFLHLFVCAHFLPNLIPMTIFFSSVLFFFCH